MQQFTARDYISALGLLPHPEGGYYRETYRDSRLYLLKNENNGADRQRNFSTAIYFLMEKGNFSAFHRISSDEVWHFYAGDPLEVLEIDEQGRLICTRVGKDLTKGEVFQYVVKAGRWFGSRVLEGGSFSLVGCTVAPGFDFADFEMAEREKLLEQFPHLTDIIEKLTR